MDRYYKCKKCKRECRAENIHYLDGDCICSECLKEYEDKFHQALDIWLTSQDKYDVSMSITDFVKLVDMIKFDFNKLQFYIPLEGVREKVETTY